MDEDREKGNKFKTGEVVYARINPTLKLVVRRYLDRIYYCKIADNPLLGEMVYFERELVDNEAGPTIKAG